MSLEAKPAEEFWLSFGAERWEKAPFCHAAGLLAPPDARALFVAAVRAAELADAPAPLASHVRLLVDGAPDFDDALMPCAADASFEAYHARLSSALGPRRYALVVNDLERFSDPLFEHFAAFLSGLYRHLGQPAGGASLALFAGNYEATPFGVHCDRLDTFVFPVIGDKRIRTWADAYVEDRPDLDKSTGYAEHLDASTLLRAAPSGLIYWPRDTFHIGEGDGGLSVSCSLLVETIPGTLDRNRGRAPDPPAALIERLVDALLLPHLAADAGAEREGGGAGRDAAIERVALEIHAALRGIDVRPLVAARWLAHLTGFGFRRIGDGIPPRERRPLLTEPVAWARVGDTLCISSRGRVELVRHSPELEERLARGEGLGPFG